MKVYISISLSNILIFFQSIDKQKFKEKQNKEEIERKRLEKIEKKKELQKIRDQIESNKKNKKITNTNTNTNTNNTSTNNNINTIDTSIKKEEKKETKLRIRLLNGKTINEIFNPNSTIYEIYNYLLKNDYLNSKDR